jgi:hypothetical protein
MGKGTDRPSLSPPIQWLQGRVYFGDKSVRAKHIISLEDAFFFLNHTCFMVSVNVLTRYLFCFYF